MWLEEDVSYCVQCPGRSFLVFEIVVQILDFAEWVSACAGFWCSGAARLSAATRMHPLVPFVKVLSTGGEAAAVCNLRCRRPDGPFNQEQYSQDEENG